MSNDAFDPPAGDSRGYPPPSFGQGPPSGDAAPGPAQGGPSYGPPPGSYGQPSPGSGAGYPGGPGYPGGQEYGGGAPFSPKAEAKGLFASLFDLSFTHFATPHIVRIVYIVAMVLIGLGALGAISTAFVAMSQGAAAMGLLLLIATPFGALLYLGLARMTMEVYVAICRSADELRRMNDRVSGR